MVAKSWGRFLQNLGMDGISVCTRVRVRVWATCVGICMHPGKCSSQSSTSRSPFLHLDFPQTRVATTPMAGEVQCLVASPLAALPLKLPQVPEPPGPALSQLPLI